MSTTDLDLTAESVPPITTQAVPHAADADADTPLTPRWVKAARAAREARGEPLVTAQLPLGMVEPAQEAHGAREREAQALAGTLGGQAVSKILVATYGTAITSVPSPLDDAPLPEPNARHRAATIDLGALWRLIKRRFQGD